jgi:hypothetical protein
VQEVRRAPDRLRDIRLDVVQVDVLLAVEPDDLLGTARLRVQAGREFRRAVGVGLSVYDE